MRSRATLALADHRPEAVGALSRLMALHDTVLLEEPPEEGFQEMLSGNLAVEDYLASLDWEYPDYGRRMFTALQGLNASGTVLLQVEPYLENLMRIHDRFAEGGRPQDLIPGTILHQVYMAEKEASAALLDFYTVSLNGTFEEIVEAVKRFARSDARRFHLRDRMRAREVAERLSAPGSHCIEAGCMHYPLWKELRYHLPKGYPLKVHFVLAEVRRKMGVHRHSYGPGDLLTLLYRFHPGYEDRRADLLSARALIFNKISEKEEFDTPAEAFPHLRHEMEMIEVVSGLSFEECRRLYILIRRASTRRSRETVLRYRKSGKNDAPRE